MGKRIVEAIEDIAIIALVLAIAIFAENIIFRFIFGVLAVGLAVGYLLLLSAKLYARYQEKLLAKQLALTAQAKRDLEELKARQGV